LEPGNDKNSGFESVLRKRKLPDFLRYYSFVCNILE